MSQIFSFQAHSVRTLTENNETWFAAIDVCRALNIDWSGKTLSAIPSCWQRMGKLPTLRRGSQQLKLISEPAVYKLAFRSNKPEADAFTNWVASDVLPSIRKTGQFSAAPQPVQAALPCAGPTLESAVYLKGKRIFDMMAKLMTDFDLVKNHVMLWGRPGARLARLSPEQESLYQNAVDASKMALCSLNQAQYALRIAMQIQILHSFDGR